MAMPPGILGDVEEFFFGIKKKISTSKIYVREYTR
jgi:hypothetical protein